MTIHDQGPPKRAAMRHANAATKPGADETGPADKLAPTAHVILDVAERLFAKHGIEKVSFRDLVAASGLRNVSMVTYHFGTREGLLSALLSRRLWLINKMHLQRLQVLSRLGKANDPHAVIGEAFRVASDAVRHEPWAANFVIVNAQVLFHPELDIQKLVSNDLNEGMEAVKRLVRSALPWLPDEVFAYRAKLAYQGSYFALALWLNANGPVTPANESGFDAFVNQTVDFLVGGVTAAAPVQS